MEKPTRSIEKFMKRVPQGPAYCRIRVSDIHKLCTLLEMQAVGERAPGLTVAGSVDSAMWGVCPDCGTWIDGRGIMLVSAKQNGGRDKKKDPRKGRRGIGRVAGGNCLSENCSCRDIVICWRIGADSRVTGLSLPRAAQVLGLSR